jgi:hypothetical protein
VRRVAPVEWGLFVLLLAAVVSGALGFLSSQVSPMRGPVGKIDVGCYMGWAEPGHDCSDTWRVVR